MFQVYIFQNYLLFWFCYEILHVILSNNFLPFQIHYYVQSHIQMNEYRDRVVLVSTSIDSFPFSEAFKYLSLIISHSYIVLLIAFCYQKIWTVYRNMHKGSGHDWSKAFCFESNEGNKYVHYQILFGQLQPTFVAIYIARQFVQNVVWFSFIDCLDQNLRKLIRGILKLDEHLRNWKLILSYSSIW